ncbi:MAG: hypothetical protein ACOYN0_01220 [Phycisphaerales bacterium]
MSNDIVLLLAKFVDAETGEPLNDPSLKVSFFDFDTLSDEFLGEATLTTEGVARIAVAQSSYRHGLTGFVGGMLGEKQPDIFCEVRDRDCPVYRTPVLWDVKTVREDPVTHRIDRTVDLGTFRFRRGEGVEHHAVSVFPMLAPF